MKRLTHQRIHNFRNRFRRCFRRQVELQGDVNLMETVEQKTTFTKDEIRNRQRQSNALEQRISELKYIAMVNGFRLPQEV